MPIAVPVAVRKRDSLPAWLRARPIPKSEILTPPSAVTITFSGFMSRWTIPRLPACWSPASSPSSTPAICANVIFVTSGRSEPRSMYSIEMYGVPSCSK